MRVVLRQPAGKFGIGEDRPRQPVLTVFPTDNEVAWGSYGCAKNEWVEKRGTMTEERRSHVWHEV